MFFRRKEREEPEAQASVATEPDDPSSVLMDDIGLFRLWYMEARMQEELARGSRIGSVFSLAFWQLRQLPGEKLTPEQLRQVAETIVQNLRNYDIPARLDEVRFAAVLLDAEFDAASTVAYRIKSELHLRIPTSGRWQAGVATFPVDGVDGNAIIQTAFRRLEGDAQAA